MKLRAPLQPPREIVRHAVVGLMFACGTLLSGGCRVDRGSTWTSYRPPSMEQVAATGSPLAAAQAAYTDAMRLDAAQASDCVDFYFAAAAQAWDAARLASPGSATGRRAWSVYRASLAGLITTAQRHERFDSRRGITVRSGSGVRLIPLVSIGFPENSQTFSELVPAVDYRAEGLQRAYRSPGVGLPLVITSRPASPPPFMREEQALAGTAVLRPRMAADAAIEAEYVLELHDPLRVSSLSGDPSHAPLARDTTAPIAFRLSQQQSDAWRNFVQPDSGASQSRLYMIEDYQAGKIPVIFVHGLLSDPLTWASLANDLRAQPGIVSAYQLWAFEYPTGQPFLKSAADLREQLAALRQTYDADQRDVAFTKVVLVGHSMGGLIAKLMVTQSGDTLWRSAARSPLEAVRTTPETRGELVRSFFFAPSPGVSRVVFVGTPHRGSAWSRRMVGRLGSSFVTESEQRRAMHAQLLRDNPGLFSAEVQRRIPTSIDLLDPESPLLASVLELPVAGDVRLHSIIGTGRSMLLEGPADGVVTVSSAQHPRIESELMVDATHSELHRHAATTREIVRILQQHAAEQSPRPAMARK